MSENGDKGLTKYDVALGMGAFAVGGAVAVALDYESGGGVARGGIGFAVVVLLCAYPTWSKVKGVGPAGQEWEALEEPYRSEFRRMILRYLVFCWGYACFCIAIVVLLVMDRLDIGFTTGLIGTGTLAFLLVSVLGGRRLRAISRKRVAESRILDSDDETGSTPHERPRTGRDPVDC